MTDYEQLIDDLRQADNLTADHKLLVVCAKAAAAIEVLNRLLYQNTQRCEALRKQLREAHESYERHLNELEAQLPKEAHWVAVDNGCGVCSNCNRQDRIDSIATHCRYCGAKMEVQEWA